MHSSVNLSDRFSALIYYVSRITTNWLLFFFGGSLRVSGQEHIPVSGPYIVVVNHMSVADALLVLLALPTRRVHFLIGEKWQRTPIIGWVAPRLGGIFVDRSRVDRQALREAERVLGAGGIMGVAPEGGRSPIGQMVRPRNGAAFFASRYRTPILPVGIVNSEQLFRNFLRLRRTRIEVRFGAPFVLPAVDGRVRHRELSAYSDYIMLRIARLVPARYHGYYRMIAHPGLNPRLTDAQLWAACLEGATRGDE